jgi:lactate dehydrogenase-like 2-hydroxyacid dehydrogenase
MKPKVFVTRPVGSEALALLATRCEVGSNPHDASMPAAELAAALSDVEGVMVAGARLTAEVLAQAPKLRAISNVGVGYDNLDLAACTARRIPATTAAGVVEETTADLAFALLLAAARRVVEGDRYVREGHWQRWQWELLWGADVHGKTLGLVGFGHIGQAMARRARGFNMRILYYTRHPVAEDVERALGAEYAALETLLGQSDFVSLHVPLTPDTRHRISGEELALMKPTAILINTARGAVVDEEALVEALERGQIAGAGLDVFEQEPHVHPTLPKLRRAVLAPHIGSGTAETRAAMARFAAQNLLDLLDGRRPATLINPEVFESE